MSGKLNYDDFCGMFGLWGELFMPFIESEEMYDIYQKLKEDAKKEIIVPDSDNVFRAFSCTDPKDIKSIWYMMDPYPKRYRNRAFQATGIAMDCSNAPDGKLQPSLEKFYEGIEKDLGKRVEWSPNLEYLLHQGVMLTNTDLTCKLNKSGSHRKLWEPFQKYFLEEVMGSYSGIIYVLAGKESHRMEKFIMPVGNYIFKIDHPVTASYSNTDWDCKNVFTKINRLLRENNNEHIWWDKRDWEENNEPPF